MTCANAQKFWMRSKHGMKGKLSKKMAQQAALDTKLFPNGITAEVLLGWVEKAVAEREADIRAMGGFESITGAGDEDSDAGVDEERYNDVAQRKISWDSTLDRELDDFILRERDFKQEARAAAKASAEATGMADDLLGEALNRTGKKSKTKATAEGSGKTKAEGKGKGTKRKIAEGDDDDEHGPFEVSDEEDDDILRDASHFTPKPGQASSSASGSGSSFAKSYPSAKTATAPPSAGGAQQNPGSEKKPLAPGGGGIQGLVTQGQQLLGAVQTSVKSKEKEQAIQETNAQVPSPKPSTWHWAYISHMGLLLQDSALKFPPKGPSTPPRLAQRLATKRHKALHHRNGVPYSPWERHNIYELWGRWTNLL